MSRKQSRDILFKLVFELCFVEPKDTSSYEEFLASCETKPLLPENFNFIKDIYLGVVNEYTNLIDIIAKNTKGYTVERLFKVDLAILLIASYEIKYYKQTPVNIVANEAVELAKKYSTEKSYSFINAVIGSIAKGE